MKKTIKFILFCMAFFFTPLQAAAADVTDYAGLNDAITSAPANPSTTTINISTESIILQNELSQISGKTIVFRSTANSAIDGSGTYGGFTAKSGSNISFINIGFRNSFSADSGAFININASSASFSGSTTSFSGGFASSGGALSAVNNSYVHFLSAAVFDSNSAVDHGGGFYSRMSTVIFEDLADFSGNFSEYTGGGFHADTGSNIVFNGHARFTGNRTEDNNGAGFYAYRSTVTFTSADFENNISYDIGGGFYSSLSRIVFSSTAAFTGNYGKYSGGAFSAGYASDIDFHGKAFFDSNSSEAEGGAADISSSAVTFYDDAVFYGNTAGSSGGAIFAEEHSLLSFNAAAAFQNNTAALYGGALAVRKSEVSFNSSSSFENNSAGAGGALFITSAKVTMGDAVFDGNSADAAGGAVYMEGTSSAASSLVINTGALTIFQNNKANNVSNALYLGSYSSAEFNTAAGAEVMMYDAIAGSGHRSELIVSGAGKFNLYNGISAIDITLSGVNGGSFNVMGGAAIDAGKLTVGTDSVFNTVNNSADTVKVTGLDIDGTLSLEVSETGAHDRILSSGEVSIGASSVLEITADLDDTDFRKKIYLIINSPESLSGIFGTVLVTTPSLANPPLMNYGDLFENWITVTLTGDRLMTEFSSLTGLSFNQKQTAKTYDLLSLTSSGDLDAVISLIEAMDENGQKQALAQVSGYFLANVIRSASVNADSNEIYDRIKNHCLYGDTENGIWAQMRGAAATYSKDENSLNDFNDTSSGVMIGFDRFMEDKKIMLGVYGRHNAHDIEQGSNEADITNTGIGFYGGFIEQQWEIKALASGSYDSYSTARKIRFADRTAKADFNGTSFSMDIEGAYKHKVDDFINFRPYIGIEAKNSHYDGFQEKGAQSMSLKVAGDNYVRSAARLGAGAVYDDNIVSWYANAEAKYLMSGQSPEIEAVFNGTDALFKSRGAQEGNIILGAVAGAAVRITRELKLFVNGSYYGADHFQHLYGNIGLRWNFCKPQRENNSKNPKNNNFKSDSYLMTTVPEDIKEMDAVITLEEFPILLDQTDEYDAAFELINASEEKNNNTLRPEEEYDAALELLNSSGEKNDALPIPSAVQPEEYDAALELLAKEELPAEIDMDDAAVAEQQQKEAAERRNKPVLKSFSLNMANFDTGKSKLTEKAKENIRLQAAEIKNFEFTKITIEGHTDSTGNASINKKLSRERAKAVFDVFTEEGIPAKKMSYIGFSSLLPVAPNSTIDGRAQNRRVEIFVE